MENSKFIKKYLIGMGIFFLFVLIISSFLLILLQPKTSVEQGFWTTISGSVSHKDSEFTTKYVYVYQDHIIYDENTRIPHNAKMIDATNIEDDLTYSITFWLPVNSQVMITPDDTGCLHKIIQISKENNSLNLDLETSSNRCYDPFTLSQDLNNRYKNIQARVNSLSKTRLDPVDNFTEFIKEDLDKVFSELSEYSYQDNKGEQNETLLRALFYLERADAYSKLAKVKLCSQEGIIYLQNDSCTLYPYIEKNDLILINNSIIITKSNLENKKLHYGDSNTILEDVEYINNERKHIEDKVGICDNSLNIIKKSKEDQKQTCNYRNNIFQFFNLSKIAFFVIIGMGLGIFFVLLIKKKTDKISQKAKYTVAVILFIISILLIIVGFLLKLVNIISLSGLVLLISSGSLFPKDIYSIIKRLLERESENDHNDRPNVIYKINQKDSNNSPITTGDHMKDFDIGSNKNNNPIKKRKK